MNRRSRGRLSLSPVTNGHKYFETVRGAVKVDFSTEIGPYRAWNRESVPRRSLLFQFQVYKPLQHAESRRGRTGRLLFSDHARIRCPLKSVGPKNRLNCGEFRGTVNCRPDSNFERNARLPPFAFRSGEPAAALNRPGHRNGDREPTGGCKRGQAIVDTLNQWSTSDYNFHSASRFESWEPIAL